jgi:membrane protease YdiL (CAAX protease family)
VTSRRVSLHTSAAPAALGACGLAAAVALRTVVGGDDPSSSLPATVVFTCALLALAWAAGERPARPAPSAVAAGVAGGAVLVAAALVGRPVLVLTPPASTFAAWSPFLVAVACAEEAVLRGALFGAAERACGTPAALLLTTIAFGFMHVPLYGVQALPLDLAVGLWLGGLRVLTGGVAAPAIAHTLADLGAGWLA